MGLLIAGIIEAIGGVGLGLYLLISQPSLGAIWGWWLISLGILTGVISVLLGKREREESLLEEGMSPANAKTSQTDTPSPQVYSLPEETSGSPGKNVMKTTLRGRVDSLHGEISRTRWRYKARDIHSRAVMVAEVVMKNHPEDESQAYDERPRQLRRLLELFILSQGYEAWANGVEPVFHLDRYGTMLSKEDIAERMEDLSQEADLLWQEIDKDSCWAHLSDDDLYRQAVGMRIRLERMTQAQERFEEIEILQMGYTSLLDHWEHEAQGSETTEGR